MNIKDELISVRYDLALAEDELRSIRVCNKELISDLNLKDEIWSKRYNRLLRKYWISNICIVIATICAIMVYI